MALVQKKPYKADTAENTVFRIREILHKKLGILLKEEHFHAYGFYSCRIAIANDGLSSLSIGTNGKGMTFEYALASAYGEFMERLQNRCLISYRTTSSIESSSSPFNLKFHVAPDEKVILFQKGEPYLRKYLRQPDIDSIEESYSGKPLVLVPFCNVTSKQIEYLPIGAIFTFCTSNGMCAGNTPKEAIIQGLNEILERYISKEIYERQISFPDIPISAFEETPVYNKLIKLSEDTNYHIHIKDCSLNIGIPAIGVLIYNQEKTKYHFHLGVDPSPITALERTLTEVYQGRFEAHLKKIDWEYQSLMLTDTVLSRKELYKTTTTGRGHHPISLLVKQPSYAFNGFDDSWGISDNEDLKKLLAIFSNLNVDVFIRDVSFLGFPAYNIFVPGISEFNSFSKLSNISNDDSQRIIRASRNLYKAGKSDVKILIKYMVENEDTGLSYLKFYNHNNIFSKYDRKIILSLLYFVTEQYKEAYNSISDYIDTHELNNKELMFFSCMRAVISTFFTTNTFKTIEAFYTKQLVSVVFKFLTDKNWLDVLKTTNCFDCIACKLKDSCGLYQTHSIVKKMEECYEKNTPNQESLMDLVTYD